MSKLTQPVVINQNILEMEYAVRGAIPRRAAQLEEAGFKTIPCNIGNPQALGQKPLSFYRQVLSLVINPFKNPTKERAGSEGAETPAPDILSAAEFILRNMPAGTGAYTASNGPRFIREAIARFIDERDRPLTDDFEAADPNRIFLTNGASEGAKYILELLISGPGDGIMIPIPQYPLYSATIRKCGGTQVNYFPDEERGWLIEKPILEEAYQSALAGGINVKCIVVINPGNPTGAIADAKTIREVIDFAEEKGLSIIADEVYQENMYGAPFRSFAAVLGQRKVPLFSLYSISKGYSGECGHRGGYLEVRNAPAVQNSNLTFLDILQKLASVSLCSNTIGQILTYLMVSQPSPGDPSYESHIREKNYILDELLRKATMIRAAFKKMAGVESFGRIGAMYLFPRLNLLPKGKTDFDYCLSLLETTGLCTVNGSGFGQKEGTAHLRIAFLPPGDLLEEVLPKWIEFHNRYVQQ